MCQLVCLIDLIGNKIMMMIIKITEIVIILIIA